MDDKLYLAVWKDCEQCEGTGRIREEDAFFIDAVTGERIEYRQCFSCSGKGKQPTFIPLKELTISSFRMSEFGGYSKSEPLDLQKAIETWMEKKDGEEKEKSNDKEKGS